MLGGSHFTDWIIALSQIEYSVYNKGKQKFVSSNTLDSNFRDRRPYLYVHSVEMKSFFILLHLASGKEWTFYSSSPWFFRRRGETEGKASPFALDCDLPEALKIAFQLSLFPPSASRSICYKKKRLMNEREMMGLLLVLGFFKCFWWLVSKLELVTSMWSGEGWVKRGNQ